MSKETNRCLNFIKGVAIILIVILHGEFPTYVGAIINMFARWGVPVFFMTSGYFLYKEDGSHYSESKLLYKIIRIFKLVIVYFVINIIYELVRDTVLYDFSIATGRLLGKISLKNMVDTVLFNRTIIGVGGWFLTAMLLAYIVLYFINKKEVYNKAYYAIVPLLTLQFVFSYVPHFLGHEIAVWYYRNTWFLALPCMLIGHYTHRNKEKIQELYPSNLVSVFILLILGIGISTIERIFIGGFSIYIGSIILALTCFWYAIKNPEKHYALSIEYIGANITLYIFIVHPFVIESMRRLTEEIGIYGNLGIQFVLPVINVAISILLSLGIFKIVRGKSK